MNPRSPSGMVSSSERSVVVTIRPSSRTLQNPLCLSMTAKPWFSLFMKSSSLANKVNLSMYGAPPQGQKVRQFPHSLHIASTWRICRCKWPGTSMATLARLGQTSVQTSQMLSQWRQRPSQPSAGGDAKNPRLL